MERRFVVEVVGGGCEGSDVACVEEYVFACEELCDGGWCDVGVV